MLSNAYFLEKFRFDIAENEPDKNLQKICKKLPILPAPGRSLRDVTAPPASSTSSWPPAKSQIFGPASSKLASVRPHAIHANSRPQVPMMRSARTYVFSNVWSNFWIIFGKRWEARSRLYRSRILQVKTRLKGLLSSWRDLQDLHLCVFWRKEPKLKMKYWTYIIQKKAE